MSLANKLSAAGATNPEQARSEPLWKGPCGEGPLGGITFSMLSRFLTCRERFRVYAIEGLRSADNFNHRIEYGNMWHVCEEYDANSQGEGAWETPLRDYVRALCKKYPLQQEQIDHWYNVCKLQFPVYVRHWQKHPSHSKITPLLQEQAFDVPYKLPSGRTVRLRGKWDSVDLEESKGIVVQENKTKGDIDEMALQRQLTWDLQSMLYLAALEESAKIADSQADGWAWTKPIAGVRYNVVRRPLSGGRGTIKQHQPSKSNPKGESSEAFYARLLNDYIAAEPEYYFMRWDIPVSSEQIQRFRRECLDPILEQLCDWYDWVGTLRQEPFDVQGSGGIHWRHPFGCVNTIDEYGASDVDGFLNDGNTVGLVRTDTLFRELQG